MIQLHKLSRYPQDLLKLLRDPNIIKAGIETIKDAQYLQDDYGIDVNGTFDLRFLAEQTGHRPLGLRELSKDVLDLDIGRNWDLINSDWEQEVLDDEQVQYAETSVKASIDIFESLIKDVITPTKRNILNYCRPITDRSYTFRSQNW